MPYTYSNIDRITVPSCPNYVLWTSTKEMIKPSENNLSAICKMKKNWRHSIVAAYGPQEAGSFFFWRKEVFFRLQEVIVLKTFSDTFCPTAAARVCGFYLSTDDESSPLSSPWALLPFLRLLCHLVQIFDKCLLFDFLFLWCLFQVFL